MFRPRLSGHSLLTTILAIGLTLASALALAADSSEIDKLLREAQKQFFDGKAQEADKTLSKAETILEEIQSSGNVAEKSKAKLVQGRVAKLRKDIDKKLGKDSAAPASEAKSEAKKAGDAAEGGALPSYVQSRFKGVETAIESGREWLEKGDARVARRQVDNARGQVSQIERSYGKYLTPQPPEYAALLNRLEELDKAVAAAESGAEQSRARADQAAADATTSSTAWLARLKPFATGLGQPGYDPEIYFVGSYTQDQKEMGRRARIFGKVQEMMETYDNSGLGDNATEELQVVVRQLNHEMDSFKEACTNMAEFYVAQARKKSEMYLKKLEAEEKKIGTADLPLPATQDVFKDARRELDLAAYLLGESEERIAGLRKQYDRLLEINVKLVRARIAETRMIADRFDGAEKKAVKQKAEEILREKKAGVEILRTTAISPDWSEESVIEWTDTTHSALRHRVTQSVSVQIAGKKDGETILYTLHIARDRRSGGGWGPLHGHIMFQDAILEENVNK